MTSGPPHHLKDAHIFIPEPPDVGQMAKMDFIYVIQLRL